MSRLPILLVLFISTAWAQKKPITLDALDEIRRRPDRSTTAVWAPDGKSFLYLEARKLMRYDAVSRAAEEVADLGEIDQPPSLSGTPAPYTWENRRAREATLQWAADGKNVLYRGETNLFLIHRDTSKDTKKWEQLTHSPEPERDPKLSPDSKKVAFRRGADLFVLDLASRKEAALTTGGSATLINGGVDWVYPEELALGTAYWWSPDSRALAYLQFDTSREPLYPHADFRGPQAVYEPQRYPQAGQNNPDVRLGVVAATGGATRWLEVGDTRNAYLIARAGWMPDSKSVYAVRLNRVQNHCELLSISVESGAATKLLEESDRFWINRGEEPEFVNDGKQFLWLSERDGYRHLYLYSTDGKPDGRSARQLTNGAWEVTGVQSVDQVAGRAYFTSSETGPLERQLYSIRLNGSDKRQLSSGAGTHSISMGSGGAFYLDTFSSLTTPPRTTLHSGDGKELGVYRDADRAVLDEYDLLPTETVSFPGPGGQRLYARMIKPAGFAASRKYPAIVQVYGGPGAQSVRNSWVGVDLDQVYAHRGFVIWEVDNRGMAGRGHSFETPVYHRLGTVELADQKAGVEYLVSLGFVDPQRVGIQGWSYGGFMTLNALLNAPQVFRAGIAGAPVTDWHNYDTIYTERYMGLPTENESGYTATSLVSKAANLKGKLMIAHNLEDDNVLFQNSMQMIQALEQAGKPFELQIYPLKTHSVTGPAVKQMNAAMLDFFERSLK
jgi:dipeptidyl-peptidase-4